MMKILMRKMILMRKKILVQLAGAAAAAAVCPVVVKAAPRPPLLGNCFVNPATVGGKAVFGFEIGESLVLHYSPEEADAGFSKFVGKTFTCSVVRYRIKKAARDKGGRVTANNSDIQMTVLSLSCGRMRLPITKLGEKAL